MLTILALLLVVFIYGFGIFPVPQEHYEWFSGLQGLTSLSCLLIFAAWVQARSKMRAKYGMVSSSYVSHRKYPCLPVFLFLLPLIALASLAVPIFFDSGLYNDVRGAISIHLVLVALFFDLFIFVSRPWKNEKTIGHETELVDYKAATTGVIEAALKGVDHDGLTQAQDALSLLPVNFPDRVNEIEYRALYLFDNLEVLASRAIDKGLLPYVQEVLGRILRLSANLLPQGGSLSTSGIEVAGRIVQKLIREGHIAAGDKSLFTFVQAIRNLDLLPAGFGDFLIRNVLEMEKGLEGLYRADKNRPIKSLLVPLAELKGTLRQDKFANHPETILGERELDRVIEVFKALESLLLTQKSPEGGQQKTNPPAP